LILNKMFNKINCLKTKKGFTIFESLIAIFVLLVGILGAMTLILNVVNLIGLSSSQLTAAYLAQEGVEIVRNIRDTNWLSSNSFDFNLSNGAYEVQYSDSSLTIAGSPRFLKINAAGYYNYIGGTDTKFTRTITLSYPAAYILNVKVDVNWQEKGKSNNFSAQANLYNFNQ